MISSHRSAGRSRRSRRGALALVALWLLLSLVAFLSPPRPRASSWSPGTPEISLRRAFDLPAEPTLLVFHHPGGFTLADRIYVDTTNRALSATKSGVRLYPCTGETQVISVAAEASEVPVLRTSLQDAPEGLGVYVTGAAAFAYDAVLVWGGVRPWVLAGVAVITALGALLEKLGLCHALVVALSAGSAGAVGSALAALVAPVFPVALTTVVSAGLAGAWAVRLLIPQTLGGTKRDSSALRSQPPASAVPVTRFQRALIEGGEATLFQALIIGVGLTGFVFDHRAGLALLIGLVTAVAVSLSETPALIALLTRPRLPRPVQAKPRLRWARLVLALVPVAGLSGLTWNMHPAEAVTYRSEAATGYALLVDAGEAGKEALKPGRLLPLHLLLQAPGVAQSGAGLTVLENLAAQLSARPNLAAVEGATALQSPPDVGGRQETPAEQMVLLAELAEKAVTLESGLRAQTEALSLLVAGLQELELPAPGTSADDEQLASLAAALNDASERLTGVGQALTSAGIELARTSTEFPELAPRLDDVPALRALPGALDSAIVELDKATADLQGIAAQVKPSAGSVLNASPQSDVLAPARVELARILNALDALTKDASRLHTDLSAAEALWAGTVVDDPVFTVPNPYLVSHDLIRLVLIPVGDPYAPAALDEAQTLMGQARRALAGSPLEGSELSLTGASALAAGRRKETLLGRLIPGLAVALLAIMLISWGTFLRAEQSLLLAIGALLSVAAGAGAALVWRSVDTGAIALVGVALLALVGGRLAVGPTLGVEELVLVLPPLALVLTGVAALVAMGWVLSVGLLAGRFLVAPVVVRWSWRTWRE